MCAQVFGSHNDFSYIIHHCVLIMEQCARVCQRRIFSQDCTDVKGDESSTQGNVFRILVQEADTGFAVLLWAASFAGLREGNVYCDTTSLCELKPKRLGSRW